MADWDADSPQLRQNLLKVLRQARDDARQRKPLSLETLRQWHRDIMYGLDSPAPESIGRFRGESPLDHIQIQVGTLYGTSADSVAAALGHFEQTLQKAIERLDALLPTNAEPTPDILAAILDVCAWAHAEWVRIHPFANGNGRTARLLANSIAMRYNLPPFIRLRPRPDDGYGHAGEQAMRGNWHPTARFFRRSLSHFLRPEKGTV